MVLTCRYYADPFPDVEDTVMVSVLQIAEMGACVSLLEYNNKEGVILFSELSHPGIQAVSKPIRVGRNECVVVTRVDKDKGYIELSKRRVYSKDLTRYEDRFDKAKTVDGILRHVADQLGYDQDEQLEDLYERTAWYFDRKHKKKAAAYDVFKKAIAEPSVLDECDITGDIKEKLLEDIRNQLTPRRPLRCRFYENSFPETGETIMAKVEYQKDEQVFVSLPEYGVLEAVALATEMTGVVGPRGSRGAVVVSSSIDVSRRRLTGIELKDCEQRFVKAKVVNSILRHVAYRLYYEQDEQLEDLYLRTAWYFDRKHMKKAAAYDVFKKAFTEPSVLDECDVTDDIKKNLLIEIRKELEPQSVEIRSDIEVSCFSYEGIEAVKQALTEGLKYSTPEMPIKINLIAAPLFAVTIRTLDREAGLGALSDCLRAIKASIEKSKGRFYLKDLEKPDFVTRVCWNLADYFRRCAEFHSRRANEFSEQLKYAEGRVDFLPGIAQNFRTNRLLAMEEANKLTKLAAPYEEFALAGEEELELEEGECSDDDEGLTTKALDKVNSTKNNEVPIVVGLRDDEHWHASVEGEGITVETDDDNLEEPSVLDECDITDDIKEKLLEDIRKRLTPQAVKIRSDIEVSCSSYEGTEAVKQALAEGLNYSTPEMPIKINLIAAPLFAVTIQTCDREAGLAAVNKALEAIKDTIEKFNGKFTIKEAPRVDESEMRKKMTELEVEGEGSDDEDREDDDGLVAPKGLDQQLDAEEASRAGNSNKKVEEEAASDEDSD